MAPLELTNLLGLPGGVVAQASLELLDRGVGRVEEGQLSFKNELHRAYVYHAMGNDRRTYHHGQLAQRLADSADRHELQTMLELVHHSIGAGLEQQAMDTALEAAEVVIAHGAPREAERVLTRLLRVYAVPAGSRLRLLLAHALVATAQYQRALDALADWRADSASTGDRALAALLRADALHRARLGSDAMIVAAAREAIALAEQANATAFLVRANYIRMEIGTDGADLGARADAESLAARIAASDATPECVALANLTFGQSLLPRGELVQAMERLTAAVPILESLALLVELRRAQSVLGICYRGLGRVEDATRVFREAGGLAEGAGGTRGIIHSRRTGEGRVGEEGRTRWWA